MKAILFLGPMMLAAATPVARTTPAHQARPIVADTATSDFEINGLHIILRRNTATDVVAANLFLLGGMQQLTPQTQGIEALLLAASGKGSRKFPGSKLREEVSRLGSEISIGASED